MMKLIDIVVLAIIVLILGAVIFYICKEKKKGVKCIGCPSGAKCEGCSGNCGGFSQGEQ